MTAVPGVLRLQLASWHWLLFPWLIVALSFAVNVMLSSTTGDGFVTGGLSIVFVFAMISAVQTVLQWWPFAAGLSVTRWHFYAAGLLLATGLAVASALAILVLTAVEEASGGWWSSLTFFGVADLWIDSPLWQGAFHTAAFLLTWTLGLLLAALGKRWGSAGVLTVLGATVVASGAATALLTVTESWAALGRLLTGPSAVLLLAGVPFALAVAVAAVTWPVLRRAAP